MLSRLSLLSRFCFALLVVVPIITSFFRVTSTSVDHYNNALSSVRQNIGLDPLDAQSAEAVPVGNLDSVQPPEEELTTSGSQGFVAGGNRIPVVGVRVEGFIVDFFPRPVASLRLPRVWALAFFAALSILVGDTVVQLFCPREVLKKDAIDFVADRTLAFSRAPSMLQLDSCFHRLQQEEGQAANLVALEEEWRLGQEQDALRLEQQIATLPAPQDAGNSQNDAYLQHLFALQEKLSAIHNQEYEATSGVFRRRVSIVELGSELLYQDLACRYGLAIMVSMVAYITGAVLVTKILQEQAWHVARAAGWL